MEPQAATPPDAHGLPLRFMTYNLLADELVRLSVGRKLQSSCAFIHPGVMCCRRTRTKKICTQTCHLRFWISSPTGVPDRLPALP